MLRRLAFWNRGHAHSVKARSKRARSAWRHNRLRNANLGVEPLEGRLVLSANPVLSVVADQFVNEGALLSITDLGTFTDVVENSGSGATIGLDPMDYTALATSTGAFDPASDVVIDTTALTISGGFSGAGTAVSANVGFGSFDIAVFSFTSFELDLGRTITATGSRPFALLSQGNMLINGTIDASAPPIVAGDQFVPGPGGGAGGDGVFPRHGDPAAGAPLLAGGQLGSGTNTSGSGGGFGGVGGTGEANGNPSGAGGITYGDLSIAIQGGSGGSASAINSGGSTDTGTVMVGGGGGGGIELGAVGSITISATGQILANGGKGRDPSSGAAANSTGGGGGAGGGILVHATDVFQTGLLSAKGGNGGTRSGAGGGGGRIMLVHSSTGLFSDNPVNQVVTGGAVGTGAGTGDATPGAAGVISIISESPGSPVIETFDFVIAWGDDSDPDTGAATIDTPGVNVGDTIVGSFNGSHTYDDDDVYVVTVTINDNNGGTDTETFLVNVANLDPTLTVDNGAVTVDEGETATNTGTFGDVPADTVALAASIGSVIGTAGNWSWSFNSTDNLPTQLVTITATDGDGGLATVSFDLTVNNLDPTADAGGPYQTFDDTPITLSGTGSDVAADLPLMFTWDLDFNGFFETSGASVAFDPVALGFTGTQTRTVALRVTDGDGGEAIVTTTVDVIGQGTIQIGSVLYVVGSSTANDSAIISTSSGSIRVLASFNSSNPTLFNESSITEIQVRLRGGHDIVVTSSSVTKLMTMDGGAGNDLLTGGGGRNVISGGTGNDVVFGAGGDDVLLGNDGNDDLFGGSGNDVLVGGNGSDILNGGSGNDVLIGSQDEDLLIGGGGEDILIGGWTSHDDNVAALDAVMAVWGSAATFSSRVTTLTGSGGLLEADVAVFDDDDDDILLGGAGRDLVFGDTNPVDGAVDLIALQAAQDVLVAVNG